MVDNGLSVTMLPARHGDSLWVEWGPADDRHRMLVDGGPRRTYDTVRQRLLALDPDDRRLDLMVVTHVDLDHIDGAIKLLRNDSLDVSYGDIWFNDYRHLDPDHPDLDLDEETRGGIQGEFLAALLDQRRSSRDSSRCRS